MKKIRVIHCLGQLNTGGAETLVMNILRNIDREKYQFDFLLFSSSEGFYDKEVKEYGSNLFYIPSMREKGFIQYIKNMITFFKKEKVDIVHAHMDWQCGFISYAAHMAGVKKIIVHSHANQIMFDRNIIYHSLIKINKILINRYATNCLACSNEAGKSLFDKKFQVLTNGIDIKSYVYPNQFIIEQLKEEFSINNNDIVLGHVGSFSKNKNQSYLIDILYELVKENPNYKLILVGSGNELANIKNKVMKLNLEENVIFTGVMKEIAEIMHLFDLFLFPSLYEGLGIVAIEAQSCGLNCIVSDNIPKEIDMNLNLITFMHLDKYKWINEIKQKIEQMIDIDEELLLKSKYNIEKTVEDIVEIYK